MIKSSLSHLSLRLLSVSLQSSVLCPVRAPISVANTTELRQTRSSFVTGSDPPLMDVFDVQKMRPGAVRMRHGILVHTHANH